jgi:hypothetical protein
MPHQCTTCGHTFADGSKEMLSGCPECGGNTFQFHPAGTDVPDEPPSEEPPEPEGGAATNRVGRAATKVRDFVGSGSAEEQSRTQSESAASGAESGAAATDAGTATGTGTGTETEASAPDPEAPWPDDAGDDATSADAGAGPAVEDDHDSEIIDADARREAAEDRAQSSARGEIASPDEGADGAAAAEAESPSGGANPSASGGSVAPSGAGDSLTDAPSAGADGPPSGEGRVVSEPTGEQPDIEELREQLNDQFESIKIVEPGEYELNLMELYNREEYIIALQENGRYVIQVPENWLGDRPGSQQS